MTRSSIKLLILGLDGASLDVIKPLCDEGKLPNFSRLLENGACGKLESTFPPITAPAWTSLATGKNPGKTGVFDFYNRVSPDGFEFKLTNSTQVKHARPYWDYLSNADIRVAVVNYPLLYPPYKINGIMVSGMGSGSRDDICYPKEFFIELMKRCGHYRTAIPWYNSEYQGDPHSLVNDIFDLLEINRKTFELLLEKAPEVLTFVISASDFAQHYMWQYIDSSHPLYQKETADEFRPVFAEIWKRIDDILGTALDTLPTDSNILIVSDHGFGRHLGSFYVNSWLYENGYLFRRNQIINLRCLRQLLSGFLKKLAPSLLVRLRRASNRDSKPAMKPLPNIDIEKSLAFSPSNSNISGQIYLNRQATDFRNGHLDYLEVKEEILDKLKESCRDRGLRVDVTLPHSVYSGEYVSMTPDSFFNINNYEYSIRSNFGREIFREPPPNLSHTGSHRKEGIFMAYGGAIKESVITEGIKIYDIAPTILHIMGLPVPEDMDGRVLWDIFMEDSEPACRQVRFVKTDGKQKVRERIQKLKASGLII